MPPRYLQHEAKCVRLRRTPYRPVRLTPASSFSCIEDVIFTTCVISATAAPRPAVAREHRSPPSRALRPAAPTGSSSTSAARPTARWRAPRRTCAGGRTPGSGGSAATCRWPTVRSTSGPGSPGVDDRAKAVARPERRARATRSTVARSKQLTRTPPVVELAAVVPSAATDRIGERHGRVDVGVVGPVLDLDAHRAGPARAPAAASRQRGHLRRHGRPAPTVDEPPAVARTAGVVARAPGVPSTVAAHVELDAVGTLVATPR